jgi:hypothetical protein
VLVVILSLPMRNAPWAHFTATSLQTSSLDGHVLFSDPKPRVAVCLAGAARTFYHPAVHESFRKHVLMPFGYDEGRADIYIDTTTGFNCESNPGWTPGQIASCQRKEAELASLENLHHIVNMTLGITSARFDVDVSLDCDHDGLGSHPCCSAKTRRNAGNNPTTWAGFLAMQRKVRCLRHAVAANRSYDYFFVTRPDLYYFENMQTLEDMATRPERVYFSSKEAGQPCYGDYIYLIPRTYIHDFIDFLGGVFNDTCEASGQMPWPPEYHLESRLAAMKPFPTQMLPWAFVIARVDSTADCGRLGNEVWHRNRAFLYKERVVSIEELCNLQVADGIFHMDLALPQANASNALT